MQGFLDRVPAHAKVLTGGHRVGEQGYFFAPTVVDGLKQDDEMVQDEVFGPVITVQTFTDEADALAKANGVRYGLAARSGRRPRPRDAHVEPARLRRGLGEHPHPVRVGDAARRLQALGVRQGLSVFGLHDYTRVKHVMHYIGE